MLKILLKIWLVSIVLGVVVQLSLWVFRAGSDVNADTNILDACNGRLDQIDAKTTVNNPADYVLSNNIYTSRNVKNSTADYYCKTLTQAGKWNEVSNSDRATISDIINYRCHQNSYTCDIDIEGRLKEKYTTARKKITNANNLKDIPTADVFFNQMLKSAAFYDTNGAIKVIPKHVLLAVIHEVSKGDMLYLDQYDYALGLFGIKRATRMVKMEKNIVAGMQSKGNDYHKYRNLDRYSLYNPVNNLLKFIQGMQAKYLKFQQTFDGSNKPLKFDSLPDTDKFKMILTAYEIGDSNIIKAYDRLLAFNKAMNCNPCSTFTRQGNSCQTIAKECSNPHPDRCGKTLPETFDHIIRFANFTGQENNADFNKYFSCTQEQLMGSDSTGPCNLGKTRAKVSRIIAGAVCLKP